MASPAVMSSGRAKTFGFIRRPAVCSGYSSRSADAAARLRLASGRGRRPTGRPAGGRSAPPRRRTGFPERGGRSPRPRAAPSSSAPASGPSSVSASMASRAFCSTSRLNAAWRCFSASSREDLREVGRMLLLQQVEQIGRGAHPQQPPDRIEDEIDSALSRHGEPLICTDGARRLSTPGASVSAISAGAGGPARRAAARRRASRREP